MSFVQFFLDLYRFYNTNQLCSDISDQYSEIENNVECRKAFAVAVDRFAPIGGTLKVVHHVHQEYIDATNPKGCFILVVGSEYHVYFNTHPNGSRNIFSRPICKRGMICNFDQIACTRIYIKEKVIGRF